ncbi:hypothetical protein L4D06_20290 [Enterovibrio makurazakiensis]|uniref:hypothetical protein n=1 Tax=Enterovibrio makurazakiensis TaxID=2910232 RepID=UPI003D1B8BE1
MIGTKRYLVTFVLSTSFLFACSSLPHRTAVQGGDVTVTPVTYTYAVSLKNKKSKLAKKELFTYLKNNKDDLLVYGAEISWKGHSAKRLAMEASRWLISAGTPRELVTLQSDSSQVVDIISLSTTIYQVQTHTCNERVIGQYHSGDDGCYSDNLRWQSMLHPDRKLAGQNRTTVLPQDSQ